MRGMDRFVRLFVLFLALLLLTGVKLDSGLAETTGGPLIRLRYAVFDPAKGEPFIVAPEKAVQAAAGPATYIVQFGGPVQEEWKEAATAAGARLYGYIPEHAFIARMDPAAREAVGSLPFVRWVGLYHTAYRMPASLRTLTVSGEADTFDALLETLPDADLDVLAAQVAALGGNVLTRSTNELSGIVRLQIPAVQMLDLAGLDGVLWVEAAPVRNLYNDAGGGGIMHANEVRSSLGLYGSGQIVAVADSGLDTGNVATIHPDVAGRINQAYALGRAGDWSDYVAHGTHVVGSVLGNGAADGSIPGSHQYADTYAGVAPEASLVFQSVADSVGSLSGIPDDLGTLFNQAYAVGARLHTNSWGASTAGDYTLDSRNADTFMWSHKDMLVLFAAGNEGEDFSLPFGVVDPDSIGSPGSAKNVLTVGASENNRPSIANTWGSSYGSPISTDLRANNATGMAAFSSRGPVDDGRVKPDIVAPGTYIASMRTRKYVFNDNLEGGTGSYTNNYVLPGGSGTSNWQLQTSDAHTTSHVWRQGVNGSFTNQSMTFLLSPPMDVRPTGGYFDVQWFHKYSLSSGEQLIIGVFNANNLLERNLYSLNDSGTLSSYVLRKVTLSVYDFFIPPSSVRIGFAIRTDTSSNSSSWQIDDLRIDGSDWGTLSSAGLTSAGSSVDDAYLMMGGTSMATPLTAGAAALVREWLVEARSFANPSAALMKATLINGAADMSPGQYGTGSTQEVPVLRPNNVTGWGRVDLTGSLNPPLPRQVWLQDYTAGLGSTGSTQTYNLTVGWTGSQAAPSSAGTAATLVQPAAGGSPPPAPVELKVDKAAASATRSTQVSADSPLLPAAAVNLGLDDGAHEQSFGLFDDADNPTISYQFIWFNRFTPAPTEFPFQLEQIWVMYDDPAGIIQVGSPIDLVVYQDADQDPASGASLLATYHATALAVDGSTWSVYNLSTPLNITGPGDVLIAAINRYVNDGVTAPTYSATRDTSTSQGRSWMGYWILEPPDPANLPTDLHLQAQALGNWMIRGYGNTSGGGVDPGNGNLRITLAWTDYPGAQSAARTLVNDLDLEVRAPDGTTYYYGNTGLYGSGNACLRSGNRDACNNVEGVFIPAAVPGVYQVTVRAAEIAIGPQPFALVASGDNLLGTASPPQMLYLPVLRR